MRSYQFLSGCLLLVPALMFSAGCSKQDVSAASSTGPLASKHASENAGDLGMTKKGKIKDPNKVRDPNKIKKPGKKPKNPAQ